MYKKSIQSILTLSCLIFSFPITSYAGGINANEQRVVSVINGTFEKDGVTYVAKQEYINQAVAYMSRDDIDLTAEGAQEAINSIYANVQTGIDEGYISPISGQTEAIEPETAVSTSAPETESEALDNGQSTSVADEETTEAETTEAETTEAETTEAESTEEAESKELQSISTSSEAEAETETADPKLTAAETEAQTVSQIPLIQEESKQAAPAFNVMYIVIVLAAAGVGALFFAITKLRYYRRVKSIKLDGLYDLHCHLIPEVDDGSKSMAESLEAIGLEYEQGVRTIICTSHLSAENDRQYPQKLQKLFDRLKEELAKEEFGKHMTLYLGNEIFYSAQVLEMIRENRIFTMAGSRYVLVEFLPGVQYRELYRGIQSLVNLGYLPILAHIERYSCLLGEEKRLVELTDVGCYFQINSSVFAGSWWNKRNRYIKKMVKAGMIQFISTDSHGMRHRKPAIKDAAAWITENCSENVANQMLYRNPGAVLEDKII